MYGETTPEAASYTETPSFMMLDLSSPETIHSIQINSTANVSISMDNVFYELVDIQKLRAYGRYVKVQPKINFTVKISRSGQIGMCNGATGVCDCLPPFTQVVEEKYTNWKGQHRTRLKTYTQSSKRVQC